MDAEIEKCERNLVDKEVEFNWIVQKLKKADPSIDDVSKLRKQLKSKEKQVIKARRQLKAKKNQKARKISERECKKFGGQAKKKERLALNRAITKEMSNQEDILSQLKNVKIAFPTEV